MQLKHKFITFAFCLLVCFGYLFPQIRHRQPNLLDIAETWAIGTDVIGNGANSFNEPARFWPVFVIERTVLNSVFRFDNSKYFMVFSVLLSITLFLIIITPNYKPTKGLITVFVCLLILVSPVTLDAYWRLGTAENMFGLVLLLSIYLLLRKKYLFLTVSLLVLMGAKETAITYIPLFLAALVVLKRYKDAFILFVYYSLFVIKLLALIEYANNHPLGYTAKYSGAFLSILRMFEYYVSANIFYILVFLASVSLLLLRTKYLNLRFILKKLRFEVFLMAVVVAGIVSLLFFTNKNQPYYFFPTMLTIFLFYFWELLRAKTLFRNTALVLTILLFFLTNTPQAALRRAIFWNNDYVGDGVFVSLVRSTKQTIRYEFNQPARGEYISALNFLYNYFRSQPRKTNYEVRLVDNIGTRTTGTGLCGKTFFGEQTCKWAVHTK